MNKAPRITELWDEFKLAALAGHTPEAIKEVQDIYYVGVSAALNAMGLFDEEVPAEEIEERITKLEEDLETYLDVAAPIQSPPPKLDS